VKKKFPLGYWNTNNIATAIVAVATYFSGQLFDWAAYIGGSPQTEHEEDAYNEVAQWGAKLDRDLAAYLARRKGYSLPPELYRE